MTSKRHASSSAEQGTLWFAIFVLVTQDAERAPLVKWIAIGYMVIYGLMFLGLLWERVAGAFDDPKPDPKPDDMRLD